MQQFLTALRPDLSPSASFTLQTLDGGTNTQTRSQAGIEAVRISLQDFIPCMV